MGGSTYSTSAIASGGHQNVQGGGSDAFLVKFNSLGVRQWGTYYGGTNNDEGFEVSADDSGNVYLTGYAASIVDIATIGSHQAIYGGGTRDAFIVKFNSIGVRQWGTYYGGAGDEVGYEVDVNNTGNIYMVGFTTSTTSIASGGYQNTIGSLGGYSDAFLVKFNSVGVRQWGTYYGGPSDDCGLGVNTDGLGNVYITGYTYSTTTIALGGHQNIFGGGFVDAFLAKFDDAPLSITTDATSSSSFCAGDNINVSYTITGTFNTGNIFTAELSNAAGSFVSPVSIGTLSSTSSGTINASIPPGAPSGIGYRVRVVSSNPVVMGTDNGTNLTINPTLLVSVSISANNTAICSGANVTFTVTPTNGGSSPSYQWQVNGANIGTNNSVYSSSTITNNDIVTCILTSNANCATGNPSTSNSITMSVSSMPTTANAGSDQAICNATTTLSGNIPGVGTGIWTVVLGSAAISSPSSPTSGIISIGVDTNILRWTINNGNCPDSFDEVMITHNQPSSSTINATACNSYTINSQTYNSTGTYTQTLINAVGCDSIITLNLTINIANVGITQTGGSGENLNANASLATYQWVNCANNFSPILGETNQNYTTTNNGAYAVIITENGCADTSACYTVAGLGVNATLPSTPIINIYPNPTENDFYIDLGKNYESVIVEIFNITGQVIYVKDYINKEKIFLSIDSPAGIYLINITTENKKKTYKLIKK